MSRTRLNSRNIGGCDGSHVTLCIMYIVGFQPTSQFVTRMSDTSFILFCLSSRLLSQLKVSMLRGLLLFRSRRLLELCQDFFRSTSGCSACYALYICVYSAYNARVLGICGLATTTSGAYKHHQHRLTTPSHALLLTSSSQHTRTGSQMPLDALHALV